MGNPECTNKKLANHAFSLLWAENHERRIKNKIKKTRPTLEEIGGILLRRKQAPKFVSRGLEPR